MWNFDQKEILLGFRIDLGGKTFNSTDLFQPTETNGSNSVQDWAGES